MDGMNFFNTAAAAPAAPSFDVSLAGLPVSGTVPAYARAHAAEADDLSFIVGDVSDAALWRAHAAEYAALEAASALQGQVRFIVLSRSLLHHFFTC
jgi:hypothetical protein